jgi:hypothetical protein
MKARVKKKSARRRRLAKKVAPPKVQKPIDRLRNPHTRSEYTIEELSAEIKKSHVHWREIWRHGTSDPFFEDGTNLNLVANHIRYWQDLARTWCERHQAAAPRIALVFVPAEMDPQWMAPGSRAGRFSLNRKEPAHAETRK